MLQKLSSIRSFRDHIKHEGGEELKCIDSNITVPQCPRRRKRDVFKSFFGYQEPLVETATLVSTGTMTDKSITSKQSSKVISTTICSSDSTRFREDNQMMTLDPHAIHGIMDSQNSDTLEGQGNMRPQEDSIRSNTSFHTRYDHSFSIEPPPRFLSKAQHAKWERSQMLRHTASRFDLASLKSKRSQLFPEAPENTTDCQKSFISRPSSCKGSVIGTESNFSLYDSSSPEPNENKVYGNNNQVMANVSTFFKSVGSLFTNSSPEKSINLENAPESTLKATNFFSPSTSVPSFEAKQWILKPSEDINQSSNHDQSFQF